MLALSELNSSMLQLGLSSPLRNSQDYDFLSTAKTMPNASFLELPYLQMRHTLYPWTDLDFMEMWDVLFNLLVINPPGDLPIDVIS